MRPSDAGAAEQVPVSKSWAIAKYEVTQELYALVTGENPSRWKGPRNSAEMMSWREAVHFCERLSQRMRSKGLIANDQIIRLPTEAEWEYAARAGTLTAYSYGDEVKDLAAYAWYSGNAAGNDPAVGALKPNPWGLYDVHGYLCEFTASEWSDGVTSPSAAQAVSDSGTEDIKIVVRGGSWKDPAERVTSAARRSLSTSAKDDAVGFRCVLAPAKMK